MKKVSILALSLLLLTLAPAKNAVATESPSKGTFFVGLGLGAGLPLSGISNVYNLALAGQLQLGYAFDPHFSLFLASQSSIFMSDIPGIGLREFLLVPTARYAFGNGKVRPYITGGLGMAFQSFESASGGPPSTTTYFAFQFAFQGGIGALMTLDHNLNLYLEGKYTEIVEMASSAQLSYLPITAGLIFDL